MNSLLEPQRKDVWTPIPFSVWFKHWPSESELISTGKKLRDSRYISSRHLKPCSITRKQTNLEVSLNRCLIRNRLLYIKWSWKRYSQGIILSFGNYFGAAIFLSFSSFLKVYPLFLGSILIETRTVILLEARFLRPSGLFLQLGNRRRADG